MFNFTLDVISVVIGLVIGIAACVTVQDLVFDKGVYHEDDSWDSTNCAGIEGSKCFKGEIMTSSDKMMLVSSFVCGCIVAFCVYIL